MSSILGEGTPPINCPMKQPWIPDVGVEKTGCPGRVHPEAMEVAPMEGQVVAKEGPNEGIPFEWRPPA